MALYKPSELHQLLNDLGIEPKKGLSQHFLIDGNILKKILIAAQLQPSDIVLEIGPGPGVLTEALLLAGAYVIAIEKDEKLAKHLNRLQNGHLEIITDDFLNVSLDSIFEKFGKKIKIVSNIPYSITGLILQNLMLKRERIDTIHLMVQKEAAERCIAAKGTKSYSFFTLFTAYHAIPQILFTVPKACFYPQPKVNSLVLELKLKPPSQTVPYVKLMTFIQSAFHMKRKMLRTSLRKYATPCCIERALEMLGLPKTARPQDLGLEEFLALCTFLERAEIVESG